MNRPQLEALLAVELGLISSEELASFPDDVPVCDRLRALGKLDSPTEEAFHRRVESLIRRGEGATFSLDDDQPPLSELELELEPEQGITQEQPRRYSMRSTTTGGLVLDAQQAQLGEGGMGRVLVIRDEHLGREIAMKELIAGQGSSAAVSRFLLEARVTAQLEHPSIVPVYELGRRADSTLYYTMRRVRGRTLHDALLECPGVTERLGLLDHFQDLCHAIAFAHSHGVIHRDIKPQNVMVGEFGETMVLDWGLARVQGTEDPQGAEMTLRVESLQVGRTVAGRALGTPAYMSPEQAQGAVDEIDALSDVWSLGAVLFEILTGHPPYSGADPFSIIESVRVEEPPQVRKIQPDAPPALAAIVSKALSRDRAERYPSVAEMSRDVEAFRTGQRVSAHSYDLWQLGLLVAQRHRSALMVAGAALVLMLSLTVIAGISITAERDRALTAESHTAHERDRAVEAERVASERLASVLAERAAAASGHVEQEILAASSLEIVESARGRGLVLEPVGLLEAQLAWRGSRGINCYDLATTSSLVACPAQHRGLLVWNLHTGEEVLHIKADPQWFNTAAFSPDGRLLATGTDDGTVIVIDMATGLTLHKNKAHSKGVVIVRFSDDGSLLVASSFAGTLSVLDLRDGTWTITKTSCDELGGVCFRPGSTEIIAGCLGEQGGAVSWDGAKLEELPWTEAPVLLPYPWGENLLLMGEGSSTVHRTDGTVVRQLDAGLQHVDAHPSGGPLALAGADGTVYTWSAPDEALVAVGRHIGPVAAVSWLSDGQHIISSGIHGDMHLWDARSGQDLYPWGGHTKWAFTAAFSPDDRWLASGSQDGTVQVWDRSTGELVASTSTPGHVLSVTWSTDSSTLVVGGQSVLLWLDPWSGKTKREESIDEVVWAVRWSDHGVVTVDDSGSVRRWMPQGGSSEVFADPSGGLVAADLDPSGRLLAVGGLGRQVSILEWPSGRLLRTLPAEVGIIRGLSFSPVGSDLAVTTTSGAVRIVSAVTGKELTVMDGHDAMALSAAWSPCGKVLFTTGSDSTLRAWDSQSGASLLQLTGFADRVEDVAISADGSSMATATWDGVIRMWDIHKIEETVPKVKTLLVAFDQEETYAITDTAVVSTDSTGTLPGLPIVTDGSARLLVQEPGGHLAIVDLSELKAQVRLNKPLKTITAAAFLSPSQILLASGTAELRLWSLDEGTTRTLESPPTNRVLAMSVSPDGLVVAISDLDTRIQLRDTAEAKLLQRFHLRHDGGITSMRWHPSGDWLITGGQNGDISVSRASNGISKTAWSAHHGPVGHLAVNPKGDMVASSGGGEVKLWEISSARLLAVLEDTDDRGPLEFSPDGSLLYIQSEQGLEARSLARLHTPGAELLEQVQLRYGVVVEGIELHPAAGIEARGPHLSP